MTVTAASDSGNFLVSPNVGVMIWTLVAFGVTLLILWKVAFPRIGEALDKRRRAIEESIDAAERTRKEADAILREYRERLREARADAECDRLEPLSATARLGNDLCDRVQVH